MSDASAKPAIFISYSHKDEPDRPREGEIRWLSFVRRHLRPAMKSGIFDVWVDHQMLGGADWDSEIEQKLRTCDIFIPLVSANSMASHAIDKEIAIIRERQAKGDDVWFYPLILTPTPNAADKIEGGIVRPYNVRPLSGYSASDLDAVMHKIVQELVDFAIRIRKEKIVRPSSAALRRTFVDITGLPEIGNYRNFAGMQLELDLLDQAWLEKSANIVSIIGRAGSGKSTLIAAWLQRLQANGYRGAEAVLGWSFQATNPTAADDEFLEWTP